MKKVTLKKDLLTGEMKPADELYCVETVGKTGNVYKKYYTSEEAYNEHIKYIENKNNCYDYMFEALEYAEGMTLGSQFFRMIKKYEYYGYDVLAETIKTMTPIIRNSIRTKDFSSEYMKLKYVFAIIDNNINDINALVKRRKKFSESIESKDNFEPIVDDLTNIGRSGSKRKDISSLVGDL